jgi:hypothetical protein
MNVKYKGKCRILEFYKCEMCHDIAKHFFIAMPSLPSLADWETMKICKKCALREAGKETINLIIGEYEEI